MQFLLLSFLSIQLQKTHTHVRLLTFPTENGRLSWKRTQDVLSCINVSSFASSYFAKQKNLSNLSPSETTSTSKQRTVTSTHFFYTLIIGPFAIFKHFPEHPFPSTRTAWDPCVHAHVYPSSFVDEIDGTNFVSHKFPENCLNLLKSCSVVSFTLEQ